MKKLATKAFLAFVFLFICISLPVTAEAQTHLSVTVAEGQRFNLRDLDDFYNEDFSLVNGSRGSDGIVSYDAGSYTICGVKEGKTTLTLIHWVNNAEITDIYTVDVTVTKGKKNSEDTGEVSFIKSKYTNFTDEEIEAASTRGTNKNILSEFHLTEFAENNRKLLEIVRFSTNSGRYGYTEDWLPEYLQEEIKTVSDVMAYFYYSGYSYAEDDQGYMSSVFGGWNKQHSAKINIVDNCGVCCETAMVVNYLLEGDYEEIGSVMVTSEYGHVYNYIKDKGTYYLVDFTDFTSNNKSQNVKQVFDEWKDRICFWSGKSLKDPSCTKAALIHDTYENDNSRNSLSLSWNNKKTGWIVAIRYEKGMEGAIASMLCDFSYQNTAMLQGVNIGWKFPVRPLEYGCYLPKYTTYQTLWINTNDDGYAGARWVDGGTVDLKLVPWYCDLNPKAQKKIKETQIKKMTRQYNDKLFAKPENYSNVKLGTGYILMNTYISNATDYSLAQIEKMLGFKLKAVK